jgi:GrpB-like predicted nucleotidyltransferase (UPF0157 family)
MSPHGSAGQRHAARLEWVVRFEEERPVLERLLASWRSADVHHIGSTSVPGLAAKPVIDMIAWVHDLAAAEAAVPILEA